MDQVALLQAGDEPVNARTLAAGGGPPLCAVGRSIGALEEAVAGACDYLSKTK
jgi:hypothetical protein